MTWKKRFVHFAERDSKTQLPTTNVKYINIHDDNYQQYYGKCKNK